MNWRWLWVCFALGGCVLGPPYERPPTTMPKTWSAPGTTRETGLPNKAHWWSSFGDPRLTALLSEAMGTSFDLRLAIDRVLVATDMLKEERSKELPRLAIGGASVDPAIDALTGHSGLESGGYELGIDARYELDFWGRVRSTADAARAELEASAFDAETAQIALASSVARTYFEIRQLDETLEIEDRRAALARERIRLAELRLQAGRVAAPAIAEAKGARRKIDALVSATGRDRILAVHRLAVLVGQAPESLSVSPAPLRKTLLLPTPPEGLPASLLERRPDLRAAESRLESMHAKVAAARAATLPQIVLTARFGFVSDVLRNAASTTSPILGAGPEIDYPIFDGGELEAKVDSRLWQRDEALAEYRKAILVALADVERALLDYQAAVESRARATASVEDRRKQVERVRARVAAGRTSRSDLIATLDAALSQENAGVLAYRAELDSLVGLYRALGGGWASGDLKPLEQGIAAEVRNAG